MPDDDGPPDPPEDPADAPAAPGRPLFKGGCDDGDAASDRDD